MKRLSLASFAAIIYMLFVITGFKADDGNVVFSIITVGVMGIMLVKSGFDLPGMVVSDTTGKLMAAYLVLCFLVLTVTPSSAYRFTLSRFNLFFPIVMYIYFKNEKKSLKTLLYVGFLVWAVIGIRAVIMYSTGQVSARDVISHKVEGNFMIGGGYGLAIGSTILGVFLLEMILWKKVKANIFNIAFIVLMCLVVFYTQSTITIIALFFGLLCAFIFRLFKISTLKEFGASQLVAVMVMIMGALLLFAYKESIGHYILNATAGSDDVVMNRLKEIGVLLTQGSESSSYLGSDMGDRMNRLSSSVDVFFDYPLFGAMLEHGSNFYQLQEIGIGSHGEFFDAFGLYGIINAIPYLGMFFVSVYRERKLQKASIGFGYIVAILILMFFNPFLFAQSNLVLFFMVPVMTLIYNSKAEETEELDSAASILSQSIVKEEGR